jgi:hypothetical protein
MRKVFTLVISICILVSLDAQIKKGSIFLGGDIGASTAETKSADTTYRKQNGVSISPVFGTAIKDNLIFGGHINFVLSNDNYTNTVEQQYNIYGAGLFLRKYKFIGSSGFSIFVQGDLGYSYYHEKSSGYSSLSSDTKRNTIYISAYPGLSFTVTKKLQLETGFNNLLYLNYWNEKYERPGTLGSSFNTNGFSIGSSLNNLSNLYLGFRLLIGK